MAQLPQEEKAKIAEQVEIFHQEKSKLDAEVAKWDDSGNDIIVLAKQMCMIMMEMTDFTRWGPKMKNWSLLIKLWNISGVYEDGKTCKILKDFDKQGCGIIKWMCVIHKLDEINSRS